MKRGILILAAVATLGCAGCFDKGEFTYNGKPIDPRCFLQDGGGDSGSVALESCTGETLKNADYVPDGDLVNDAEHGLGYNFQCEEGCAAQPFIYYKVIGRQDNHYLVLITQNSGGTGVFSSLRMISRDGDILRTEQIIAGGDRCNGGVTKASMTAASISYSQSLTPYDLIEMSGGNAETKFEAYNDIQACAVCCVAEANYTNGQLTGVTLTTAPVDVPADIDGEKDACFFKSYIKSYKQLGVALDTVRLRDFGRNFSKSCAALSSH